LQYDPKVRRTVSSITPDVSDAVIGDTGYVVDPVKARAEAERKRAQHLPPGSKGGDETRRA
jgi:hypothetical protein